MPVLLEKGLFQKFYIPPPKTQGKEYFSGQTFIPGTFLRVNFDDPKTSHTQGLRVLIPILCPGTRMHFSGLFPKTQVQLPFFVPFSSPRLSDFSNLPETCGCYVFRPREKEKEEE